MQKLFREFEEESFNHWKHYVSWLKNNWYKRDWITFTSSIYDLIILALVVIRNGSWLAITFFTEPLMRIIIFLVVKIKRQLKK